MKKITTIISMAALVFSMTAGAAFASHSLPFKSTGTGTETSLSPVGCQFTAAGCTIESKGSGTSSHMGADTYVSDLTVDWAAATSNGAGGFCAPAAGPSTITAANGDTVTLQNTGTVCEVGATAEHAQHTFSGTYTITGGTGRFAGASGSGKESGGDDGYGNSNYTLSGTISY